MSTEQRPVVQVRPSERVQTRQGVPYFLGISHDTAGARALSLNLIEIPPGAEGEAHAHCGYETAIYILEGRVLTRWGEGLRQTIVSEPGDFVFIPPDVPHQPVNLASDRPARAIVARNDPSGMDTVKLYNP